MSRFSTIGGLLIVALLASACAGGSARRVPDDLRDGSLDPLEDIHPASLTRVGRLTEDEIERQVDPLEKMFANIEISRERGDWREGEYWISQVPLGRGADFARWFEPRAQSLPPLWIYAGARKLHDSGQSLKAAFWYIVARERHIRHLRRCRDDSAKAQLTWADGTFAVLRGDMSKNPELTRYAAKHGFTWLDLNRDTDMGLIASCTWGEWGADRAKAGDLVPAERAGGLVHVLTPPPIDEPAKWIIPAGEIHQIRIWSRILMKQEIAKILGEPDELPPTPTVTPLR